MSIMRPKNTTQWGAAWIEFKACERFFAKLRSLDFVFKVMQKQQ